MKAVVKAFGNGVFVIGGTLTLVALPTAWLWWIGTGEVSGPVVIVMVPLALFNLLFALGMVAAVGDAMEKWEG